MTQIVPEPALSAAVASSVCPLSAASETVEVLSQKSVQVANSTTARGFDLLIWKHRVMWCFSRGG